MSSYAEEWEEVRKALFPKYESYITQLEALNMPRLDIVRALIFKIFIDDDTTTYHATTLRYYVRSILPTSPD